MDVDVWGVGNKETKAARTLETNEEALVMKPNQEENDKLAWMED